MKFCSEAIVQEKRRKWIVKDKKEYTGTSLVHDPYTDTCTARRDVAQTLTQLYSQEVKQTLSWYCIPVPERHVGVHSRAWVLENYPVYICSAVIYIVLSCNLFLVLQWKA